MGRVYALGGPWRPERAGPSMRRAISDGMVPVVTER